MHGLPRDIDLRFFNGQTLLQACFGLHELILNFDNGVSVTVMSSLAYIGSNGSIEQSEDFRETAPAVLALLNQTILSAEGTEAGTLTLRFDGGGMLIIYDDSEHYESYTIQHGAQTIVV